MDMIFCSALTPVRREVVISNPPPSFSFSDLTARASFSAFCREKVPFFIAPPIIKAVSGWGNPENLLYHF